MPVNVPPASGNLVAIELVTVVEKLASSPKAAASSLRVFKAEGELSIRLVMAVLTNAVVAILVVLLPAVCVEVVGFPPKATSSAIFALVIESLASCVAVIVPSAITLLLP